jgi:hypothetical protein
MTFVVVYFLVFGTGIYYMLKLMHAGPQITDGKGRDKDVKDANDESGDVSELDSSRRPPLVLPA